MTKTIQYPSAEIRRPRTHFTKQLEKICARLDNTSAMFFEIDDSFLDETDVSQIGVESVWVVGSYAAGASTCGDLDLVVKAVKLSGTLWPKKSAINRSLLGSLPDVRPYLGTPDENSSHVPFPNARLVWQPGMDWRAAIAAILPDPDATRFARPTDKLPFRMEQLGWTYRSVEQLISQEALGIITWKFTPISDIPAVLDDTDDNRSFKYRIGRFGAQKRKLVPYLRGFLALHPEWVGSGWNSSDKEGIDYRHSGVSFLLGVPDVLVHHLDNVDTVRLVIAPFLNRRGPNGFWTIERGPNHPLTLAFAKVKAWTLAEPDGQCLIGLTGSRPRYATYIDITSSEADAINLAEDGYPMDPGEPSYTPLLVQGTALLNLLAQADVIFADSGELPLTWPGRLACRHDDNDELRPALTTEEILQQLVTTD